MIKTAVFGGTTEGRLIAEELFQNGYDVSLFVATTLGEEIAREKGCKFNIFHGKLDEENMEKAIFKGNFTLVIDSTHPYAVEVTRNIKSACKKLNLKYLRLVREDDFFPDAKYIEKIEDLKNFKFNGNILFTTGSKETSKLGNINGRKDFFIRVLPTEFSINAAQEEGFLKENIITGKGPFSEEENIKLIKKYDIKYLITKDSGKTGGLFQKVEACRKCKTEIIIIKRPDEEGLTFEEMSQAIKKGTL